MHSVPQPLSSVHLQRNQSIQAALDQESAKLMRKAGGAQGKALAAALFGDQEPERQRLTQMEIRKIRQSRAHAKGERQQKKDNARKTASRRFQR